MKHLIATFGIVPLIWLLCWIHHLVTHPFRDVYPWEWAWYARFFPLDVSMFVLFCLYCLWVIYLWVEREGGAKC